MGDDSPGHELTTNKGNYDTQVVRGFGDEWSRLNQADLSEPDRRALFDNYFRIFPWELVSVHSSGADIGCGSGRWAMLVASRVGVLHCIDPSEQALGVARRNLASLGNVRFHQVSVDALPFQNASLDFAYSLGVLHHVPGTAAAIGSVASKLKPGAPFLIYLYYAFDNRPAWYRFLWRISNWMRFVVARLSLPLRFGVSQVLAGAVYWPVARFARWLDRFGRLSKNWPLAYYRDKDFYVMRTDALDRFGTRLEQRFTRSQIKAMLEDAGFTDVRFCDFPPYWCAVAIRK